MCGARQLPEWHVSGSSRSHAGLFGQHRLRRGASMRERSVSQRVPGQFRLLRLHDGCGLRTGFLRHAGRSGSPVPNGELLFIGKRLHRRNLHRELTDARPARIPRRDLGSQDYGTRARLELGGLGRLDHDRLGDHEPREKPARPGHAAHYPLESPDFMAALSAPRSSRKPQSSAKFRSNLRPNRD